MDPNSPFENVIGDTWASFRSNAAGILLLCLLASTPLIAATVWEINVSDGGALQEITRSLVAAKLAGMAAQLIVGTLVTAAVTSLSLIEAQRGVTDIGEALRAAATKLPRLAVLSIVQFLVVFVGMLMLVIPGIIAALRLSLAAPILMDRDVTPIDACRQSWSLTRPHWAGLAWLYFIAFLLGVVGTLVSFPLLMAGGALGINGHYLAASVVGGVSSTILMVPGCLLCANAYMRLRGQMAFLHPSDVGAGEGAE
ncbi:MAG: hypothetical protein H6699_01010 [Myxococcales bacterium]|nr:hypothetical protein [Myxococcales bacterium]